MAGEKLPVKPGETILSARHLVKTYGKGQSLIRALDDVSLEIRAGELLVILGSSGSGKSTLLNMLGGMDQPDSGNIVFRGENIAGINDRELTRYRKEHIGFVFQNFNLIPELTALENVDLTADRAEDPQIALHMLELVGLGERADAYSSQMSGGQQQRTSIARALAKRSELLLCDEPTGALDSETGMQILVQLEELVRIHGKTVVIVTHTREVGRMADRTITIRNGKIVREEQNGQIVSAREIAW
jgi:putative ABC transport system ATP-binding protein